jgi:hypothetical protein
MEQVLELRQGKVMPHYNKKLKSEFLLNKMNRGNNFESWRVMKYYLLGESSK